ncbi:hypothetical protein A2I96_15335 [Pseudoalteromonas tetraodonis]|uniref:Uncharacterized protein n=1 Tax=Pseudoalteromonas tetraodonis TaxID=43659 RepID=A0ABD4EPP3_9GAMM|nr:hypothetical protein [Pseudoalteromonas spiralis]KYL34523.1 hypothetical protein A2I96_15335 [Pseudoalteromonas spiralis]
MNLKSSDYRNKKLYYRRAQWDGKVKRTLESLIAEAHKSFPTVGERTFIKSTGEVRCASDKVDKGIYLHIAGYKPGESTSTIEVDRGLSESSVYTEIPPTGKDYLDGDIFAYVTGNHVLFCTSGLREGNLRYYLQKIIGRLGHIEIEQSFSLMKVANTDKIAMIQKEGVKEIKLNVSLYEASLVHANKKANEPSGICATVANELKAIFSNDPKLSQISELENLNVGLSLSFDGASARKNTKKADFGENGKLRLLKTAEALIRDCDPDLDEDEFVIITNKQNEIRASEINITSPVKIQKHGKSVSKIGAWENLRAYYNGLKELGSLSK